MPELQYPQPDCPTDCDSGVLPTVDFADCVQALELFESEICDVFIALPDTANPGEALDGPADWTLAADWETAIGSGVLQIPGIGDMPEPERSEITLQKRWIKHSDGTYMVNFDVLDLNSDAYSALREWQCGATLHIWLATIGGHLFGGPEGITANLLPPSFPKERGEENYEKALLQFRWVAKADPLRIENPMIEPSGGGGGV